MWFFFQSFDFAPPLVVFYPSVQKAYLNSHKHMFRLIGNTEIIIFNLLFPWYQIIICQKLLPKNDYSMCSYYNTMPKVAALRIQNNFWMCTMFYISKMQCTICCEKCFKVISVKEHQPMMDQSRMSYFFFVLRYLEFIVYKREEGKRLAAVTKDQSRHLIYSSCVSLCQLHQWCM